MYKIILAIRYLVRRKISYFSVAATALCVFVVFVVITVLSGLTAEFKRNTHLSVGDCVVSSKSMVGFGYYEEFVEMLGAAGFIEAASPVIKSYAIVHGGDFGEKPMVIMGLEPAAHSRATGFGGWLCYNKGDVVSAFEPAYDPNLAGCVPGVDLLFNRDSEGSYEITEELPREKFEVSSFPLTAKGALAKAGAGEVSTKTFYCSDVAHSGVASADGHTIYLPFEAAQALCGMNVGLKRVNAIHIKFKPGVKLGFGCDRVRGLWEDFTKTKAGAKEANLLENVRVQTWKTYSRLFVAAVETEQTMMIVIFGMIGIIMVFVVFVVFYMIVSHKSKDIGILKSVGASNGNVLVLFLGFAFLVGLLGAVIGAFGGWQFLVHINRIEDWLFRHFEFQLWDRRLYAIGDIPNAIDLKVLAGIIVSAVFACFLGALVPSWQAAKLEPVETLQVSRL
ncbi:MAG: ABC transporter permease [Planctomycetota bacterium]|jgi:ABC-type lipoprotein release transport system permease subunit